MGLIEDAFEHSLPGIVIGAIATSVLLPLVGGRTAANGANGGGRGRPLLKTAVRGYIAVADRIKEATAEAREEMSDLAAEVREERRLRQEEAAAKAAANPEPEQGSAVPAGPGSAG